MRRAVSLVTTLVATLALVGVMGCTKAQIRQLNNANNNANSAARKDCAACEKMCTVAGDAESNPDGVAACKADCQKTCQ